VALSQDFSKAARQAVATGAPDEESSCRLPRYGIRSTSSLQPLADTLPGHLRMLYNGIRCDIIVSEFSTHIRAAEFKQ